MASKMNILLVIDSLSSGGAQRQIVWLALGLADRSHHVTLLNYYPEHDHFRHELKGAGIEIVDARKSYRFDLRPAFEIRKTILAHDIDAVVSFLNTPNVYAIIATIGLKRTKTIVSERAMFSDSRLPIQSWLRYQSYRFADVVTVNSHHQCERIQRRFPSLQEKLVTIWNGVDLAKYTPSIMTRTPTSPGIRLIAAATVEPYKNAYNLIKGVDFAKKQGVQLRIDWAGKVSSTDTGQREFDRCQKLIQELHLEEDWRWLGEQSNMQDLYPQYDALVHPSYLEGLPNAVCEGLASGLIILASAIGDHHLLVENRVNGWLFDPKEPKSAADALLQLARLSPSARLTMSHASREMAKLKLSLGTYVDSYEQQLLEMSRT
jgi:glycosyltransferase involved in cell wall biosynthesis